MQIFDWIVETVDHKQQVGNYKKLLYNYFGGGTLNLFYLENLLTRLAVEVLRGEFQIA